MDIKTFEDLAKLADTCRKKGIESIKIGIDSVEFKLSEAPRRIRKSKDTEIETHNLTDEDVLFWSSSGIN